MAAITNSLQTTKIDFKAAMQQEIYITEVKPQSKDWQLFLTMSVGYIQTYWPDALENDTVEQFQEKYEKLLGERYNVGGRGFFLLRDGKDAVGLANVWLDDEKKLNVSEFFVVPTCRRKGYGKKFLGMLKGFGQTIGARAWKIEVDKGLEPANSFWSSFGFTLDSSGERNVYSGPFSS